MLSDAEKRWLAKRTEGLRPECRRCDQMNGDRTGCTYVPPYHGEWCFLEAENQDWWEACVFEASVALAAAKGDNFLRPQGCSWWENGERKTNCPPGYDIEKCAGLPFCNLYRARIMTEEEIVMEEAAKEAWRCPTCSA